MRTLLAVTGCALFVGMNAQAQDGKELPFAPMLEAAQAALSACKAEGNIVAVVVTDRDGAPKIILRDTADAIHVESTRRKAYTVVKTGMSSGDFGKSLGANVPKAPAPTAADPNPRTPGINGDKDLIAAPGGIPVKVGGMIVGAIAVGGSHSAANGLRGGIVDENCAKAGLDKVAGKF